MLTRPASPHPNSRTIIIPHKGKKIIHIVLICVVICGFLSVLVSSGILILAGKSRKNSQSIVKVPYDGNEHYNLRIFLENREKYRGGVKI